MRIILVNTRHYFGGGDSTDCFNLAELLRAKGHSVAFFAMSSRANLPDSNEDLFVSHIDFRAISHRMHPANCYRVLSRVIYFKEARDKFEKLIDRFRPDIVHLHNIHGHISPSVIFAAKKRGLPVVWRLHDYKLICPNSHYLVDATEEICEACGQGRYFQAIFKRCKKNSFLASAMAAGEAYLHQLMGICSKVDFFLPPSIFL
jgi:glycosyltransferase involved in cell wall biosynthesis